VYHIRDLRKEFGLASRWVGVVLDEIPMVMRKQFLLYLEKRGIKYAMCLDDWGDRYSYWLVVMPKDGRERRRVRSVLHYYGFVKYERDDLLFTDKELKGLNLMKVFERKEDGFYY